MQHCAEKDPRSACYGARFSEKTTMFPTERYVDIVGVTGSIPVTPTIRSSIFSMCYFPFWGRRKKRATGLSKPLLLLLAASLASCGTSAPFKDAGRAPSIEHKSTVDSARRGPQHCPDCGGRFPPAKRGVGQ